MSFRSREISVDKMVILRLLKHSLSVMRYIFMIIFNLKLENLHQQQKTLGFVGTVIEIENLQETDIWGLIHKTI